MKLTRQLINILEHTILIDIFALISFAATRDIFQSFLLATIGMFLVEAIEGRNWAWWGRVAEWGLSRLDGFSVLKMTILYPLGLSEKGSDPFWDWAGPAILLILEIQLFAMLAGIDGLF